MAALWQRVGKRLHDLFPVVQVRFPRVPRASQRAHVADMVGLVARAAGQDRRTFLLYVVCATALLLYALVNFSMAWARARDTPSVGGGTDSIVLRVHVCLCE